jgi:hypothetical protein
MVCGQIFSSAAEISVDLAENLSQELATLALL